MPKEQIKNNDPKNKKTDKKKVDLDQNQISQFKNEKMNKRKNYECISSEVNNKINESSV